MHRAPPKEVAVAVEGVDLGVTDQGLTVEQLHQLALESSVFVIDTDGTLEVVWDRTTRPAGHGNQAAESEPTQPTVQPSTIRDQLRSAWEGTADKHKPEKNTHVFVNPYTFIPLPHHACDRHGIGDTDPHAPKATRVPPRTPSAAPSTSPGACSAQCCCGKNGTAAPGCRAANECPTCLGPRSKAPSARSTKPWPGDASAWSTRPIPPHREHASSAHRDGWQLARVSRVDTSGRPVEVALCDESVRIEATNLLGRLSVNDLSDEVVFRPRGDSPSDLATHGKVTRPKHILRPIHSWRPQMTRRRRNPVPRETPSARRVCGGCRDGCVLRRRHPGCLASS